MSTLRENHCIRCEQVATNVHHLCIQSRKGGHAGHNSRHNKTDDWSQELVYISKRFCFNTLPLLWNAPCYVIPYIANHHNHNMQFYLLLLTPVCVSIRPCPHPHPPFFEKLEGDTKQVKFWLQTLKSRVISVNKEWFCNKDLVATYIHTSYQWQAHHLHMVAHQCRCSCFSSVGLYNTASVRTHHTTKSMSMLIADDQGPPHSMSVFYA